ncbi:MAG: acyl--CoA ligase [Alphaproteobacteria bacterium]
MSGANTVWNLIANGQDTAPAITASGRSALDYAGLREHAKQTVEKLNALGIGRNDRVAIVLPNGPEMAAAFITIACGATTAPLNPDYRAEELEFYLTDLNAKALVVEQGSTSPAVDVAKKMGVAVHEIIWNDSDPAGYFTITTPSNDTGAAPSGGMAEADDIAMVLHTSGTTSRPKLVPLSQINVTQSAHNVGASVALTPDGRCMNIMPLFHIHGLIAAVLTSVGAGASVFCTTGFNALRFFSLMDEAKPNWYTAVPTMHQAILSRAPRNAKTIAEYPLRFIRSSSSSLPPQVMAELEKTFSTPVIEAYGMTEAAHQMACNPLPPKARKPGTVGLAAGPEVAIMNLEGRILDQGETGEIVIRGANVTPGYEANDAANAEAFTDGWFRTGDQGVLDDEGYLSITGRLKEIINRGGEKISPREVDEILLDHAAVGQVVTFAMPHDKLGEEVAAAVVLREGAAATEEELRAFTREHLADFKVPRKILFLDEIPKGATGKLQRIGLAEKLGLVK